jgi:hypothetical protein
MATRKYILLTATLGLALGLAACGKDGTSTNPWANTLYTQSGFRVIDSDPRPQDSGIAIVQEIKVMFSDSVDPSTIPGNFTLIETATGSAPSDITANCAISFDSNYKTNDTLICPHSVSFNPNARYQVSMSIGIKSATGLNLVAPTTFIFSTGTMDGSGSMSVAGPPVVTSWINYSNYGTGCFEAIQADFNEDLQAPPRATFTAVSDLLGWKTNIATLPLYGQPNSYASGSRSWWFFLTAPCNPRYFDIGAENKIVINEAIDLTGERGDPNVNQNLWHGQNL